MAEYDAFANATDDELRQMVGLSTLPDQNALLMDALRQAQALRQQNQNGAKGHTSKLGAILGGIGGLINQGRGVMDEKKAMGGINANLDQARQGRLTSAQIQARELRRLEGRQDSLLDRLLGGGAPQAGAIPPQAPPMGGSLAGAQPGGMPPPQISTLGAPDMLKQEEDPTAFLQGLMPGYPRW